LIRFYGIEKIGIMPNFKALYLFFLLEIKKYLFITLPQNKHNKYNLLLTIIIKSYIIYLLIGGII